MKKIIATIAASVLSVAAMAQKPGDGVLRIHTTDGEVTPHLHQKHQEHDL